MRNVSLQLQWLPPQQLAPQPRSRFLFLAASFSLCKINLERNSGLRAGQMRTEIERRHKSGFVPTEQELRRIAQSCQEHATKVGAREALEIPAKLRDGAVVECHSVDDVVTLENGGQKQITRLAMICDSGLNESDKKSMIKVQFEDEYLNLQSLDSVSITVIGESRDDVFVAAADLDERIAKTQIRAWTYMSSRPWFFLDSISSCFSIAFDFLEVFKKQQMPYSILYERRRNTARVFWTVLVLGVIASMMRVGCYRYSTVRERADPDLTAGEAELARQAHGLAAAIANDLAGSCVATCMA